MTTWLTSSNESTTEEISEVFEGLKEAKETLSTTDKETRKLSPARYKQLQFEINPYRKEIGKSPILPKVRSCLRCNLKFESEGPWERLCGCQNEVNYYGDVLQTSPRGIK